MRLHVDSVLKGSPPRAFDKNRYELVDPKNTESHKHYGAMCGRRRSSRSELFKWMLATSSLTAGEHKPSSVFLARASCDRADAEYSDAPGNRIASKRWRDLFVVARSDARLNAEQITCESKSSSGSAQAIDRAQLAARDRARRANE